jgi:perosamine synthetase
MKKKLIKKLKNSKYKPLLKKIYRLFIKTYPYEVGNEIGIVKNVLKSGIWNMSNSQGIHKILEKEFAEYIGVKHAIVVNTGGVAIQMSIRALGLQKGDEIIHQVDTCVANAFAVMNAGTVPVFADVSLETFKLDFNCLEKLVTPNTKAIMPIHVWGNSENMDMVKNFANKYNLKIIEDCALAFGAEYNSQKLGSFGDVGIFSFGSTKPIQAGEGGIITTNDDKLAKKLRAMRMWGEMTQEYGIRDHEILSWNGRTSEIIVAVMLEQFRGYEKRYKNLKDNVEYFIEAIKDIKYISIADINNYNTRPSYSQVVIRLNTLIDKSCFMDRLKEENISVWHANFEPITTISFFKKTIWKEWTDARNIEWLSLNYNKQFQNSKIVYEKIGIGLMPNNFLTRKTTKVILSKIQNILLNMDIKN